MNTIDEVMTYLTTIDGAYLRRRYSFIGGVCFYVGDTFDRVPINIVKAIEKRHWFNSETIDRDTNKLTASDTHTWKPKAKSEKLTDAQYVALRDFASNPYVTEYGSWYSADHKLMSGSTSAHTLRRLLADKYIERTVVNFSHYLTITPSGIAAHDTESAKKGMKTFAAAKETADAYRAQADATRDAKRIATEQIGVDNPVTRIYMVGKPHTIRIEIDGGMLVLPARLDAADIDDFATLLTAAKRELARRESERANEYREPDDNHILAGGI